MRSFLAVLFMTLAVPAFADEATPAAPTATPTPESKKEEAGNPKTVVRCEAHGVKKALCARCNPKLAPAFKSKGDWCGEHERPESQCAVCKPKLEKEGVKP